MQRRRICLAAAVWTMALAGTLRAGVLDGDGMGAYGDSMTMQYSQWVPAAAFFGVDLHSDGTQFNWVDHLVMSGYNFGSQAFFLGRFPYNVYNAGIVGVSSESALYEVSMVQDYLAARQIKTVAISIGANDFGNDDFYSNFYNRTANGSYNPLNDPDAQLVTDIIVGNIADAIEATLALNPDARFVLHTVPDLGITPKYIASRPSASRRARVSPVFDKVNAEIIALAEQYGAPVVDLNALASYLVSEGEVAGIPLLPSGGTTGNHAFLSDGFHPGTVIQGFMANAVLLAHQKAWGDPVALVSDQTIATRAGLTPLVPGETYNDISRFVIFVPEPSALVQAALASIALLAAVRKKRNPAAI